jgi:hypothetical protein
MDQPQGEDAAAPSFFRVGTADGHDAPLHPVMRHTTTAESDAACNRYFLT